MKKRNLLVFSSVAFVAMILVWFIRAKESRIGEDCLDLARSWSTGRDSTRVELLCGMRPLSDDARERAIRLLNKISGQFEIVNQQTSAQFADTQGVFFTVKFEDGKNLQFGIQGHRSKGKTAVEFERLLGVSCMLQMKRSGSSTTSYYAAMSQVMPKYLTDLESVEPGAVTINGFGYTNWSRALSRMTELAKEESQ